ncbi:MAG: protein kinase, partial [Gemmatimonadetes bacterium]|nr:protein kinase [Gemmatimonadota bacterium]
MTITGLVGMGGWAAVYRAHDLQHGRDVAIKVLRPELAATLGPDRFKHEIETAARLQHPHILPLFSSGEAEGRLYYVMPYVDGESLRDRLSREGALPIGEAIGIFREIVDALGEAHGRGFVHRDIKPDNVLLRGGHAVVADFGIAKAVTDSVDRPDLTGTGILMGTPRYMAPEQATGDPATDHRADLFAAGAVAYEMLTGRPPFEGKNVRAQLTAVLAATPVPPHQRRTEIPEPLGNLILACLAKDPRERPQSAGEILAEVEALGSPAGPSAQGGGLALGLAAVLYAGFSWIVFLVSTTLSEQFGLPGWFVPLTLIFLAVGFPVTLATAFAQRGSRRRAPGSGSPWTWKRASLGGLGAFGGLAVAGIAWTVLRGLGIGPVGTLLATGVLEERDVILLTDFESPSEDAVLPGVVTEALRVDLAQSATVRVADAGFLGPALARMQRPPDDRITRTLGRELSEREGFKAMITGEVAPVGAGYQLTARLERPADGAVLVAHRETARDSTELLEAIDALSTRLRERIGEPLRSLASTPPLQQVTTSDLEALRRYSEAVQLPEAAYSRRIRLLEEAIAHDSTFAFAWRGLSIAYQNHDYAPSRALAASTRAFELREGLTAAERAQVEWYFYHQVRREPMRAIQALESAVARDSSDMRAIANLGQSYRRVGELQTALELMERALAIDSTSAIPLMSVPLVHFELGDFERAQDGIDRLYHFGHFPYGELLQAFSHAVRRDYHEAERILAPVPPDLEANPYMLALVTRELTRMTGPLGRLADYRSRMDRTIDLQVAADVVPEALRLSGVAALTEAMARGRPDRTSVDDALERFPMADMDPIERPYLDLADVYAQLGYPEEAAALLDEFDSATPDAFAYGYRFRRSRALGHIALAEGRFDAAITAFRASTTGYQAPWDLAGLARAFDAAGRPDSARVYYDAYLEKREYLRMESDQFYLAGFLERLAELEYQAGATREAARHYAELVEL